MTAGSSRPVDRLVEILRRLGCEIGDEWEFHRTSSTPIATVA